MFPQLPDDVNLLLLSQLDVNAAVAITSRAHNDLFNSEQLWLHYIERDFGFKVPAGHNPQRIYFNLKKKHDHSAWQKYFEVFRNILAEIESMPTEAKTAQYVYEKVLTALQTENVFIPDFIIKDCTAKCVQAYLKDMEPNQIKQIITTPIENHNVESCFRFAAKGGYASVVKIMLDALSNEGRVQIISQENDTGDSLLAEAARNGCTQTIEALLSDLDLSDRVRLINQYKGQLSDMGGPEGVGHTPIYEAFLNKKHAVGRVLFNALGSLAIQACVTSNLSSLLEQRKITKSALGDLYGEILLENNIEITAEQAADEYKDAIALFAEYEIYIASYCNDQDLEIAIEALKPNTILSYVFCDIEYSLKPIFRKIDLKHQVEQLKSTIHDMNYDEILEAIQFMLPPNCYPSGYLYSGDVLSIKRHNDIVLAELMQYYLQGLTIDQRIEFMQTTDTSWRKATLLYEPARHGYIQTLKVLLKDLDRTTRITLLEEKDVASVVILSHRLVLNPLS